VFLVLVLIVGDVLLVETDDCGDWLEIGLHLLVMTSALIWFAGFYKVWHGFEYFPKSTILTDFKFTVVILDKHQIAKLFVFIPMTSFGINMRVTKFLLFLKDCWFLHWLNLRRTILNFNSWWMTIHVLAFNYINTNLTIIVITNVETFIFVM